jgi:hypothetical protein
LVAAATQINLRKQFGKLGFTPHAEYQTGTHKTAHLLKIFGAEAVLEYRIRNTGTGRI